MFACIFYLYKLFLVLSSMLEAKLGKMYFYFCVFFFFFTRSKKVLASIHCRHFFVFMDRSFAK